MRIVAGEWRGASLIVPDTTETRPTMDRTRQAVFNILRSAQWALDEDGVPLLRDSLVLDVCAGSGAMAFEALSQGAAKAALFEQQALAIQSIEKNIIKLRGAGDKARLIKGDVLRAPKNNDVPSRVAFFDPPYKQGLIGPAIETLLAQGWIAAGTLMVLEMEKNEAFSAPQGITLQMHDARIYGTSKIVFATVG